jgi:preprotein translocase subunit YajC
MASIAFAQQGGVPAGIGSLLGPLVPILLLFLIFYVLLIRPQQKKVRELQAMLQGLKRDDVVLTSGGLLGKIIGLTDQYVTLEIAEKVRVKVARNAIARVVEDPSKGLQGPSPS